MTPAEELRAAATKLRATAAHAAAGPWHIRPGNDVSSNVADRNDDLIIDGGGYASGDKAIVYGAALNGDAAWISLVNPLLAEPLAQLLEDQAAMYEHYLLRGADVAERIVWHGLGVARVINGGAS